MNSPHLRGLQTLNTPGSPQAITVMPGEAWDSTNTVDLMLSTAISKTLGAPWVEDTGTGAVLGGLDTGTVAPNTSYFVHLIGNGAGAVDVLLSAAPTSPALPSGWTVRRRVVGLTTDPYCNVYPYLQVGYEIELVTPRECYAVNGPLPEAVTLSTPLGVKMLARLDVEFPPTNADGGYMAIRDPDLGVPNVSAIGGMAFGLRIPGSPACAYAFASGSVRTNTAGQVYIMDQSAAGTIYIQLQGWRDDLDVFQ